MAGAKILDEIVFGPKNSEFARFSLLETIVFKRRIFRKLKAGKFRVKNYVFRKPDYGDHQASGERHAGV